MRHTELKPKCQLYHLIHGVTGEIVLSMGAADPRRFQLLFLFFLILSPLFLLLSLSVSEGLIRVSAPDG